MVLVRGRGSHRDTRRWRDLEGQDPMVQDQDPWFRIKIHKMRIHKFKICKLRILKYQRTPYRLETSQGQGGREPKHGVEHNTRLCHCRHNLSPLVVPIKFTDWATAIGEAITSTVLSPVKDMLDERMAQFAQFQQLSQPQVQMSQVQTQNMIQNQSMSNLSVEAKHLRDFKKYNLNIFNGPLKNLTNAKLWISTMKRFSII
ncbi:uncharacterized protein LOC120072991 [Benincasa hispida]|uniref:uncharacterized protein LOC120072991 n=1 Tax=Benincasa hispida TaxID=102211 RepID=UPI001901C182|nr:uncharacterized protein LOC120072991 [Benincasa hispida]